MHFSYLWLCTCSCQECELGGHFVEFDVLAEMKSGTAIISGKGWV